MPVRFFCIGECWRWRAIAKVAEGIIKQPLVAAQGRAKTCTTPAKREVTRSRGRAPADRLIPQELSGAAAHSKTQPKRDEFAGRRGADVLLRKAQIFLSEDRILDSSDRKLKRIGTPNLLPCQEILRSVKAKTRSSAAGKYLILRLDAKEKVAERNEMNNEVVFGPLT